MTSDEDLRTTLSLTGVGTPSRPGNDPAGTNAPNLKDFSKTDFSEPDEEMEYLSALLTDVATDLGVDLKARAFPAGSYRALMRQKPFVSLFEERKENGDV